MQGVYRDDDGIVHALDADDHLGGHSLQHFRGFLQPYHCRVAGDAGGAAGRFVDFRHTAGKGLVADGAYRHSRSLSELQRKDVALVHVDGYFRADIRRKRKQGRLRVSADRGLIVIHAADRSAERRNNAAAAIDLHQFEEIVFKRLPFFYQRLISGGIGSVGQAEQR